MKYIYLPIILLLAIANMAFSQKIDSNYTSQWKEIDTLITGQNLTKKALQKVDILYTNAIQSNYPQQQIKALLYKIALQEKIEDYNPTSKIKLLQNRLDSSSNPIVQSIIHCLIANTYLQYFNNNRWQYYNRSNTINYAKADVLTWSSDDFNKAIAYHFITSLKDKFVLQNIAIEDYSTLIVKGKDSKLRPTLFDVLAHEALDYFKTGEAYISKPTYAFTINSSKALGSVNDFIQASFTNVDSASNLLLCLQLFQQLIKANLNKPGALIDVNLERIQWVYSNSILANKMALQKSALEEIITQYPRNPNTLQAYYLQTKNYTNQADTYKAFVDTTYRFSYIKALANINKALEIDTSVHNEGSSNLKHLKNKIEEQKVEVQIEKVNELYKRFKALVSYKNVETLYTKIVNISYNDSIYTLANYNQFDYANTLSSIRKTIYTLPNTNDYQTHAVEIKIDALPYGAYALISSTNKNFDEDNDVNNITFFYVSNIAFIQNGRKDLYVVNRETGEPINKATILVLSKIKDWQNNKIYYQNVGSRTTDAKGFCTINSMKESNYYELIIETKGDRLRLRNDMYWGYENNNDQEERIQKSIYFFTDRSIYRPGQKLYFKALAITNTRQINSSKLLILKDSIIVYLYNANYKIIDSIRCKQNDFGSIAGTFILPQNELTGNFSLQAKQIENGRANFSVEEYKRPTYTVALSKPAGNYRLGDTITVIGSAKGYAGNSIDNATVKYSVKRNSQYRNISYWNRDNNRNNTSAEITFGTAITDAAGNFVITFKATPDSLLNKVDDPIFLYTVEATITDIAGESKIANTSISVAYKALQLNVFLPKLELVDSFKTISLQATNLSNQKIETSVKLTIQAVQSPNKIYRERLWQRADVFVMDKKQYEKDFPLDEYNDENNMLNWPIMATVFEKTATTSKDKLIDINCRMAALKPGYYKVVATATDMYGEMVTAFNYIQLYSNNNFGNVINFVPTNYFTTEPGKVVSFSTGSAYNNLYVLQQNITQKNRYQNLYSDVVVMQRGKGLQEINRTIEEANRGGIAIQEIFIKNNRTYTNVYNISVPYTNKELQVSYTSFRDKTEPGSNEKWTVNVQGNKGETVAAELLTSMYDASLNQFKPHGFSAPFIYNNMYASNTFSVDQSFGKNSSYIQYQNDKINSYAKEYPYLKKHINYFFKNPVNIEGNLNEIVVIGYGTQRKANMTGSIATMQSKKLSSNGIPGNSDKIRLSGTASIAADNKPIQEEEYSKVFTPISTSQTTDITPTIRKNFNETAFFFPQLQADTSGSFSFSFTMPESTTQWQWQSFAHTKFLAFGTQSAIITTQKKLMVQTNTTRFLREGDKLEWVAKLNNISDKELTGTITLELIDASTNTSIDGWFQNVFPTQYFTVEAGASTAIKFPIAIPFGFNKPLLYKVVAKAKESSSKENVYTIGDGEEKILPVITNRQLVTESLPIQLIGDTTKTFVFKKLLEQSSETLTNESLTVEYTTQPIWNAIKALPYLIEYPYECAEQTFNKFYANALAASIVAKYPKIKMVFDKWKNDTNALKSNLQKNEELKQVILQETPWILEAESQQQQQKNIALLFDVLQMSSSKNKAMEQLLQMQLPSGAFAWFKGGYEDRYITNYILTGIGKLKMLQAIDKETTNKLSVLINNAIRYLDNKIVEDYDYLIKKKIELNTQNIGTTQLEYLYMRSFFTDYSVLNKIGYNYYYNQAKQFWIKQSLYAQALTGFICSRNKELDFTLKNIVPSIIDNAIINEQGMYWKNMSTTNWYKNEVEFASTIVALLHEVNEQNTSTNLATNITQICTWILLNKQTNNWKTTIATADAIYALLLTNNGILAVEKEVKIKLGNTVINSKKIDNKEEGTGYFKQRINGEKVINSMGNITVTTTSNTKLKTNQVSYGAVYWQYFEQNEKITSSAENPLFISKKMFKEINTTTGKKLEPINEYDEISIGDKVIVQLVLKADRDMQYIHLKDTRSATMEPINVFSGYRYKDGLGYYEATKDASTNFFISYLSKGTYVFEYPVFITHSGVFSNGIANIQCMYAPEFTSHSAGAIIRVK